MNYHEAVDSNNKSGQILWIFDFDVDE